VATTEAPLNLLRRVKTAGEIDALIQAAAPDSRLRQALVERYDELAAVPKRDPSASLPRTTTSEQ
jgi:hypothetical protein